MDSQVELESCKIHSQSTFFTANETGTQSKLMLLCDQHENPNSQLNYYIRFIISSVSPFTSFFRYPPNQVKSFVKPE